MTTLRASIQRIFSRAGWHLVVADRVDVYSFPLIAADGDVRPPVIVLWDRGDDWEPNQHLGGQWTRHTNHGDVLSSLTHAAERGA